MEGGVIMTNKDAEFDPEIESQIEEALSVLERCPRRNSPDPEMTSELLSKVIGNRTLTEFAEIIHESVSKLSRISAGKTITLKNRMIAKIAVFASKDSDVTLDKLMEAQGFVLSQRTRTTQPVFLKECRKIIVDELLQNNCFVNYIIMQHKYRLFDFALITDALWEEKKKWLFECKSFLDTSDNTIKRSYEFWLYQAMAAYYSGESYGRLSLIVDTKDIFDRIIKMVSNYQIKDEISIILISTVSGRVLDEYIIPLTDGRKPISLFAKSER